MLLVTIQTQYVQFVVVFLIFILVLVITYFTTRWIGSYQKKHMSGRNIQVVESFRLSNNKVIEIVKVAGKSFLIAVCKDTVTLLGEIDEDKLDFSEPTVSQEAFGSVFSRFKVSNKEVSEDEDKEE